jgi:uncharacterized membrane protein
MEESIYLFAEYAALVAEGAAVLLVTYGTIEALVRLIRVIVHPGATYGVRKRIWRGLGVWLLLALEFALASDIIRSVAAPTWRDIGELGAIAVIRTFLNYFLERDLEHAKDTEAVAERDRRVGEASAEPIAAR